MYLFNWQKRNFELVKNFRKLKASGNRANMLEWFAILYFSKQKATSILGFSFIRLMTIYQECQNVKQQHV